jgi:biopolymer transport protein ExbD
MSDRLFAPHNMVFVDLAKAEHPVAMPDAGSDDAIVVAVLRDGAVFLGLDKVDPARLGSRIRANRTDRTGETMYLRADRRAQYRDVENAIEATVDDGQLPIERVRDIPSGPVDRPYPGRGNLSCEILRPLLSSKPLFHEFGPIRLSLVRCRAKMKCIGFKRGFPAARSATHVRRFFGNCAWRVFCVDNLSVRSSMTDAATVSESRIFLAGHGSANARISFFLWRRFITRC